VFAAAARTFFDREAPEGYLDDWATALGNTDAAAPSKGANVSLLLFRLEDEWLALATAVVVEVTSTRTVHRIPHRTGPVLAGLVNLRGQLHLCVSLHGLLGVEPSPNAAADQATARLVVIRRDHEAWAFAADEVLGVHRVSRDVLRGVPSTLANPAVSFSQAVFPWNGRSVGYLDEQRVFSSLRSTGR
jgi:chemotaxis-related protein WspD